MAGATSNMTHSMQARQLFKRFQKREVVANVGLSIGRGRIVALLGPNGAGKTTVMSMMTGILKPDSGSISIDGQDVTTLPIHARAQLGLSYLPQEDSVFSGLSVEDNIMLYLEASEPSRHRRRQRLETILGEFGLTEIRKQRGGRLSGGQRRRCEVARALAANPSYILLDEPFAGVDPLAITDLKQTISAFRTRGMGVLISDHNVRETLSLVDFAYILVGGRLLASGTPDEIKADPEVRQFYLGSSLDT
jgi:lipopolysaccharide export system ATP-binding protein